MELPINTTALSQNDVAVSRGFTTSSPYFLRINGLSFTLIKERNRDIEVVFGICIARAYCITLCVYHFPAFQLRAYEVQGQHAHIRSVHLFIIHTKLRPWPRAQESDLWMNELTKEKGGTEIRKDSRGKEEIRWVRFLPDVVAVKSLGLTSAIPKPED
jgi:hypothetical protein